MAKQMELTYYIFNTKDTSDLYFKRIAYITSDLVKDYVFT